MAWSIHEGWIIPRLDFEKNWNSNRAMMKMCIKPHYSQRMRQVTMKTILSLLLAVGAAAALEDAEFSKTSSHAQNSGPQGRIVGGTEAKPHSLPYQVGYFTYSSEGKSWCGGTLIAPNWVLTAAHCLHRARRALVYVGVHDNTKNHERGQGRISVDRRNFVIHEYWSFANVQNDIALIRLPTAVTLSASVQPIKLPSRSEAKRSLAGTDVTVSGWGMYSDYIDKGSPKLLKVNVPVISEQSCRQYFPRIVRPSNLCTSGKFYRSPCSGDSGGPLAADLSSGRTLVGIVSFGSTEGCQIGWPGVYTKVGSYLDWISRKTGIEIQG